MLLALSSVIFFIFFHSLYKRRSLVLIALYFLPNRKRFNRIQPNCTRRTDTSNRVILISFDWRHGDTNKFSITCVADQRHCHHFSPIDSASLHCMEDCCSVSARSRGTCAKSDYVHALAEWFSFEEIKQSHWRSHELPMWLLVHHMELG